MSKSKKEQSTEKIGPRLKCTLIIIWSHMLFLTWAILSYNNSLTVQTISLVSSIAIMYLHIVIIQDYFYLKTHPKCTKFRNDIRLIKPLLPERLKKK